MFYMFYIIIHTIFTISVMVIGLPYTLYIIMKGIEGFIKFGFGKLPRNYLLIDPYLGKYAWKLFVFGLVMFVMNIWILFLDKGGHLFLFIDEWRSILGG